eukprot:NODE_4270_length_819_cov_19.394805_g3533_i0.p2 GENE.NODE_4270_length_819_cov_19.394805_g3533_i0~~NODE_4270_length_819_cov_19.394805_g3533_i0.p2  ORF type:complete len:133 (+),score=14.40 NODE_4270_length_819_cov_19.394805_g3533_i0:30-401(+)
MLGEIACEVVCYSLTPSRPEIAVSIARQVDVGPNLFAEAVHELVHGPRMARRLVDVLRGGRSISRDWNHGWQGAREPRFFIGVHQSRNDDTANQQRNLNALEEPAQEAARSLASRGGPARPSH